MNYNVKQIVERYKRKTGTSDPFKIADYLNIEIGIGDIGTRAGCYMYIKKHKCIFLNENLEDHESRFVMAHELGHAILHPRENCYFLRNKTMLSNTKTETEANKFAIELLLPDSDLAEYMSLGYTVDQISRATGFHQKLIELRLGR